MDTQQQPTYKRHPHFTTLLIFFFLIAVMLPNCILAHTEPYTVWSTLALLLLPTGFYLMWSVAHRRSGVMIWWGFPFIFMAAFQIVLLYLFGNSVIATDMFTNVLTTNPGEATELLANIWPSVISVAVIYLPLLWFAAQEIIHHREIDTTVRRRVATIGGVIFTAGALLLIPAYRVSDEGHVVRDEIFPVNAFYNVGVSASEFYKVCHYPKTSKDFRFEAERTDSVAEREIYVYVIGEAARAMNWQLYGYERPTNPMLTERADSIIIFRNILTQSNTTHKSVPLFLSSVATNEHNELYKRKGLPALFNEAGFETWFLSNQSPQGAMIDHLANDADHIIYMDDPRFDLQLLDTMRQQIEQSHARKMFFILHCYGSHFCYHQRYPREEAYFLPDDDVAITTNNVEMLRNAYDNSIRYADRFLATTIDYLQSLEGDVTALLYCSDHGEDMLDDERGRFLHASPTTTAYQLYVASFVWFSQGYRAAFPQKVEAARAHTDVATTTHAMFHTIADMASVEGKTLDRTVSLVSAEFDVTAPRYYLNDHNEAVPFRKTGLDYRDEVIFSRLGIKP